MLFAIIGTIDRGNFVFDRWPRVKQFPKVKKSITAGQLSQKLAQYFYYFGIFRKSRVFTTSQAEFSQSCFIQIFNANQKRLEVVLGIDDECVMVSRSVFIINNQKNFIQTPMTSISTNLYVFQDLEQDKKDIVNSVTLVWKATKFEEVQIIKNKLSFMVGVLRHMQQSQDFLSKQIIKITQAKNNFEKKIKEKCLQISKDTSAIYQQFKVRQMFQEYYDLADQYIKQLEIFNQISKFFISCVSDSQYSVNKQSWISSVGHDFKVPIFKIIKQSSNRVYPEIYDQRSEVQTNMSQCSRENEQQKIDKMLVKTTLATQKKLELLPQVLRDERINKLYDSVLNINDVSLEQVLVKNKELSKKGSIQTIQFLKQNQIGKCVYPFDLKSCYNLYSLKRMPSWSLIKKFDTKIFPNQNILKQIHPFAKYKRISILDEKLKYIILQDIIDEVYVYVYYIQNLKQDQPNKVKHFNALDYLQQDEESETPGFDTHIRSLQPQINKQFLNPIAEQGINRYNLLMKFVNKPYNLNQILYYEPQFEKISQILKLVINKMQKKINKNKSKIQDKMEIQQNDLLSKPRWGFYYVERC